MGYASRMHPETLSGEVSGVACQELMVTFSFFLHGYKQGVCILNAPGYSSGRDQRSSETFSFRFFKIQVFVSSCTGTMNTHIHKYSLILADTTTFLCMYRIGQCRKFLKIALKSPKRSLSQIHQNFQ